MRSDPLTTAERDEGKGLLTVIVERSKYNFREFRNLASKAFSLLLQAILVSFFLIRITQVLVHPIRLHAPVSDPPSADSLGFSMVVLISDDGVGSCMKSPQS